DAVTASWAANGNVRLTSRPALEGTGEQAASGEQTFIVKQPTRFTLAATRLFGSATAEADVAVAPPERGYGAVAQCDVDRRLITTQFRVDSVSAQMRVDRVGNPLDRVLRVDKGSRTVRMAPHEH